MKPVLTERGKRILAKALAVMRQYPETVEMGDWYNHTSRRDPDAERRPAPYCGTAACLAGHIALIATRKRPSNGYDLYKVSGLPRWLQSAIPWTREPGQAHSAQVALSALGVPEEGRLDAEDALFYSRNWPQEFKDRLYEDGATARQRVAAVIARVRHWLKTGE